MRKANSRKEAEAKEVVKIEQEVQFWRSLSELFKIILLQGLASLLFVDCIHHKASGMTISRTVYLESPNFTGTSVPTYFTATLVVTSLTTSGRKLSWKTGENAASDGSGWNFFREWFE